jgi:hypothetical protein
MSWLPGDFEHGEAWGWPAETITHEADRADLERHAEEIERHETFNYAVLSDDESALLGCVYIDPPDERSAPGAGAVASWWVVDSEAGGPLEQALDDFVPRWLSERWGFSSVDYSP